MDEGIHDLTRVEEILHDAENSGRMSNWEQNFVADMLAKIAQYGRDTYISDRQLTVIDHLEDKLYS